MPFLPAESKERAASRPTATVEALSPANTAIAIQEAETATGHDDRCGASPVASGDVIRPTTIRRRHDPISMTVSYLGFAEEPRCSVEQQQRRH